MNNFIVSLSRRAVNLAATAALVALLASLGALNIPAIVGSTLALNALCGVILKMEFHFSDADKKPVVSE